MSDNFYTIQSGDTLSKIASKHATTVQDLCKINAIENPNRVSVGQRIALKQEAVCKVTFQFLDRDHNPLTNAKIRLGYCGKEIEFDTGINGRLPDIVTETPSDMVTIWIARANGEWKEIKQVTSDWGNKLVTFVSPKVRLEARTQSHPKDVSGRPVKDKLNPKSRKKELKPTRKKTAVPATTQAKGKTQSTFGAGKGTKLEEKTNAQGLPVAVVTNDQMELEFLDNFTGEILLDEDFKWAAHQLGVEEAVIRAINEVEAQGNGFVMLNGRSVPKILYERHYFHRITEGIYSADNPDISFPSGYYQKNVKYVPATQTVIDGNGQARVISYWRRYNKKKDNELKSGIQSGQQLLNSGAATSNRDLYMAVKGSYKRLCKAYTLDKDAALRSCSWGGFQIMGNWYSEMGYSSATEFAMAMSRSEKEQIRALVLFFKHVDTSLIKAMKDKNFAALASGFNGPAYKDNKYDDKLEESYKKWSQKK